MNHNNSDFIAKICEIGEVYVVGGAVRNYLYNCFHNTNKQIKDYDYLVRFVDIHKLTNILKKFGSIKEVGKSFGILLFTPNGSHNSFEFALPRTETSIGSGYRDFIVIPDHTISLDEDFSRRDATINAIGFRIYSLHDVDKLNVAVHRTPNLEEFVDPFNGIDDIRIKVWRCVGDPHKRFIEDPTRIMRAFRQSAELNLDIEFETLKSISVNYKLMESLVPQSYVRLFNELLRFLDTNPTSHRPHLMVMEKLQILNFLGIDSAHDISMDCSIIVKFGMLIRPDEMKIDMKKWCDTRQISATNYINPDDVNILVSIQKYSQDLEEINTRYDLLKLIQKIYGSHRLQYKAIITNMSDYLKLTNKISKDHYQKIKLLLTETNTYPPSTDQLAISGYILMEKWKMVGKQIKQTKEMLLDKVYLDEIKNNLDDLHYFLSSLNVYK